MCDDEDNVVEWINCDASDSGIEHLTDEKIVSWAFGKNFRDREKWTRNISEWAATNQF